MSTMARVINFSNIGLNLDKDVTSAEAMKMAGLDWEVEIRPLYATSDEKSYSRIPYYGTFRSDNGDWLQGIVTDRYASLQNVDAFKFMDSIVEKAEAKYEAVGSMNHGSRIWILARLPKTIEVVKNDPIFTYILLSNSHDARSSVTATFTSIRMRCENQMRMALSAKNSRNSVQIRHTSSVKASLLEAQNTFHTALGFFDAEEKVIKKASLTPMDKKMAQEILCESFDPIDHRSYDQLPAQTQNRIDDISNLFDNGIGNSLPKIRNTAYALLNAASEYDTHHRSVRNLHSGIKVEEKRLEKIWFGSSIQEKVMRVLSTKLG